MLWHDTQRIYIRAGSMYAQPVGTERINLATCGIRCGFGKPMLQRNLVDKFLD